MPIRTGRVPRTALTCLALAVAGLLAAGCGSSPSATAAKTAAVKVPASALGQPGLMASQARRLQRWIDALPEG